MERYSHDALPVNVYCVPTHRAKWAMTSLAPEDVPRYLCRLRERAGLTKTALARAMGYKTDSGYVRFETDARRVPFTDKWLDKLACALVGKGEPPIARADIDVLREDPKEQEKPRDFPDADAVALAAEVSMITYLREHRLDDEDQELVAKNFSSAFAAVAWEATVQMRGGMKKDDPQLRALLTGLVKGLMVQRRQ